MISNQVNILDVFVHPVTVEELHQEIKNLVDKGAHALVLNVNVYCLNLAYEQPWLRVFLNSADINFCDGAGVRLGARILGQSIPERITYADWTWQLAEFSAANGLSLFLLGARPGVAAAAAEHLQQHFPNLEIAGVHHGYFDKRDSSNENQSVIQKINAVRPNVLILGFGMPLQERWLMENWDKIDANVALTGGAVFDYVSGELTRAPKWMTDNGLEWLGRLIIEPKRLWQRYIIGNPLFIARVLKQRYSLLTQKRLSN